MKFILDYNSYPQLGDLVVEFLLLLSGLVPSQFELLSQIL